MPKRRTILTIVVIIIVGIPIISIGSVFASCAFNSLQYKRNAENIQSNLSRSSLPISKLRIGSNGSCTKGVDAMFYVEKQYSSSLDAKNDIIREFRANGISSTPELSDSPRMVPTSLHGATGGATPIEVINLSYNKDSDYGYDFFTELTTPTSCEVVRDSSVKVLCGGIEIDTKVAELFASQPVTKVRVWARIY